MHLWKVYCNQKSVDMWNRLLRARHIVNILVVSWFNFDYITIDICLNSGYFGTVPKRCLFNRGGCPVNFTFWSSCQVSCTWCRTTQNYSISKNFLSTLSRIWSLSKNYPATHTWLFSTVQGHYHVTIKRGANLSEQKTTTPIHFGHGKAVLLKKDHLICTCKVKVYNEPCNISIKCGCIEFFHLFI